MPDEMLPVPLKVTSVNIGAHIVQAPELSKGDSSKAHIPISTDNNKGSSTKSPPKPIHILVLPNDKEGI